MRFLPRMSKQVDSAPFMNGVRVATLVVGMMLLAPHGASAQSACMCADTGMELPISLSEADAEALQEALESRDELDVARLVLAPPVESEDLPWCTNQNDPQCSKRPAGAVPSLVSIGSAPVFALSIPLALPSPFCVDRDFAEYSCGGPRDAMRSKLERPPQ
jgi:hypothetical protein